ncbi:MAG: hypothetical protein ACP5LD_10520 [Desulfomonilaceae bacterium]
MWKDYAVTWQFSGLLCGSVPQAKEMVRPWLESRKPAKKPEGARSIDEIEQEVLETIDADLIERITLGFQRDEEGLFVRGATIKAHIKDCANQVKEVVRKLHFKDKDKLGLKALVANKVYVAEYQVYLLRNGNHVKAEDGEREQPVHVMTAQGERSALKIIRYVEKPEIRFTLRVLDDGVITEEILGTIFDYGSVHGYGGERSMGEGRYAWSMKAI